MFSIVHNSMQKITNISIMKPIILISILNKYLDNLKYLDSRTPLGHVQSVHMRTLPYEYQTRYRIFDLFLSSPHAWL